MEKIQRNTIFTNQAIGVNNSQYDVHRLEECPQKSKVEILEDDAYFLCCSRHNNIGHFFHDQFFPFYVRWREQKSKVLVYTNENTFFLDFVIATLGRDYVITMDSSKTYESEYFMFAPEGRELFLESPDYVEIINEIRDNCFSHYKIIPNRTKNYMFSRAKLERKKLLNLDDSFLKDAKIEDIPNLHELNFEDVLKFMAQAKSFIYMVGAGTFYKVFFNENVHVLEINPYCNNSWADFFGLKDVCRLHLYISKNTQPKPAESKRSELLNAHVLFDAPLREACYQLVHGRYKTSLPHAISSNFLRLKRYTKRKLNGK